MRRARPRRGAILLDVALAISVLVVAGMVILHALAQAIETQRVARERSRLVDLARSALALIESGAASAESLNGPVKAWPAMLSEGGGVGGAGGGGSMEAGAPSAAGGPAWSLKIETRPFGAGEGLAVVTVESRREGGGMAALALTLRQVVRMSAARRAEVGAAGGGGE